MSLPVSWVVGLLIALEPTAPWRGTYERTAEAIVRVSDAEPLFEEQGPARTATLLVALAWYESRLKPDAKSANGQWYCLYQIDKHWLPDPKKALEDPETCTRAAVKLLRESLAKCAKNAKDDRLALYMSGKCDQGLAESRYRTFLGNKLLREHPVPVPEEKVGPVARNK